MSQASQQSRTRQILTIGGVVIIVAVIAVFAWSVRPGQSDLTAQSVAESQTGSQVSTTDLPIGMIDSNVPKPDDPAPDFVLPMADGTKVRLSEYRGRPVFLNFWADWCPFCKQEMPDMQAIQTEFGDDVVVIGVNAGDPVSVGESFVESVGVSYTILYDTELQITDGYNVQAMPTSYFIDSAGNIANFNFGFMTFDQMMTKLESAINSKR